MIRTARKRVLRRVRYRSPFVKTVLRRALFVPRAHVHGLRKKTRMQVVISALPGNTPETQ